MHQVYASEVLVGRENAVGIFARNVHKPRQTCAGCNEERLKTALPQSFERNGAADDGISHKLNAHLGEVVDFGVNYFLGQTELGNTVFQHATNLVKCLIYSNIVTEFSHISRPRQRCGTRTDGSNFDAVGLCNLGHRHLAALTLVVGSKTLQITNCNSRFFEFLSVETLAFTLFFLRANAATDSWKRGSFLDYGSRAKEILSLDFLDEFWDVDIDGAAGNAGRVGTIEAAVRFLNCHFDRETEVNFLVVAATLHCVLHRHLHAFHVGALLCRYRFAEVHTPLLLPL